MSLRLFLDGEERATIVRSDGRFVELTATRAFPPGATLRGAAEGGGGVFAVKVKGCRRRAAGEEGADGFAVEGRFVNLTRGQREALGRAGCLAGGAAG